MQPLTEVHAIEVIDNLWVGRGRVGDRLPSNIDSDVSMSGVSLLGSSHIPSSLLIRAGADPLDRPELMAVRDWTVSLIERGHAVLVHCANGLTMAPLMGALVISDIRGVTSAHAISMLKEIVGQDVLTQPELAGWLLQLDYEELF